MTNSMYKNTERLWAPRWPPGNMGKFEKQALEGAKIKPYVWWRFLDDIFIIWTENEDELKEFIDY